MSRPEEFLEYLVKRSGIESPSNEEDYNDVLRQELKGLIVQIIYLVKTAGNHKERARYIDSLTNLVKLYLLIQGEITAREQEKKKQRGTTVRLSLNEVLERIRGTVDTTATDEETLVNLDEAIFQILDEEEKDIEPSGEL